MSTRRFPSRRASPRPSPPAASRPRASSPTSKTRQLKKGTKMPRFRRSLFWDVDPKTIDPDKHARYIIERILDFGNDREVRWMWRRYPQGDIRHVVQTSRVLHAPTRSLWTLLTQP